ncbi:redoxin domain-containing protein [Gracilimonas amylolytica]|uniref:redoxin domain-containing protein n=1 Tax=Gracilimonas amylolytica TaxID=1749045 RepID=UPI000CD8B08F|nr:redoxin domain-containing protein [Gracilimonas amylolytica]
MKAKDFTLKDTDNKEVTLSSFEGRKNVVILFFPLAFSSVCTTELCTTRDNMKLYDALDAEVLAISVDSTFSLKAFKDANNLNYTLLSDFNKNVSEDYNVLYEDFFGMKGVSKRAVFVVNKKGDVEYQEVLENAGDMPDLNKVQDVLAQLN